jgi:dynein heavy chain
LIKNLEFSKKLSTKISNKVKIAKEIQIGIAATSENYRPAAERGALLFFLMNELYKIHSFSLNSFIIVVSRAIDIVAERINPKKADKAIGEAAVEGAEGEAAEAG